MRGAYYMMIAWVFLFGFVVMRQLKTSRQQIHNKPALFRAGSDRKKAKEYEKMLSTFAQQNQKEGDSSLSENPAGTIAQSTGTTENAQKAIQYIQNFYKISDMNNNQEDTKTIPTLTNASFSDPLGTIKSYYKIMENK